MTMAHGALLLAACAPGPTAGEPRGASAAQAMDPFLSLAWTAEADQDGAYFGGSVSSAGDVNGDGYGDVVVGAARFDNGSAKVGRAYAHHGSAGGLDPVATWTVESDQDYSEFGHSVSSAGDVNGDGYGDVIVGAHWYDLGSATVGRAYVYHGSTCGLDPTATWTAESDQHAPSFGFSVSSAGDVNGDGYGDVVVGAYRFDAAENDEGRAFVYLGSAAGLDATDAWTADSDQEDANLGASVSSAGDVNGDGYGDVVVGAPDYDHGSTNEGRVYLYLGSAAGLDQIATWYAESNLPFSKFGYSVSSAGDVNGDGYGDVVVGAYQYQAFDGRAYMYLGSASALDPTAAWTGESDQGFDYFGFSVSSAGDVNGDGYGDVVVGATHSDDGSDEGRAFLYLGSAAGLDPIVTWTAEPGQENAFYGTSVSSAGDVNSDGFGDVLVGAPNYDNGSENEGRVFLYEGGCYDIVDSDADSVGDACDACAGFDDALDADVDGVPDDCDVCPMDADPAQADGDNDAIGEACECDDANPTSYPGAPELCDGVDNNCDGVLSPDEIDDDGDASPSCIDCNDQDAARFPGAEERCNDIDDDCDGAVGPNEIDADGDLYSACDGDCDDAEPRANSHLIELCGDAIDNNCDGVVDEACGSDTGDTGCACNGEGGAGALSLLELAVLLRTARRRRST